MSRNALKPLRVANGVGRALELFDGGLVLLMGVHMELNKSRSRRMLAVALAGAVAAIAWPSASSATAPSQANFQAMASAVDNAINGAKANGEAAVAAALASETKTLISEYSAANPLTIAEIVIAEAVKDGASNKSIGQGMADAALAENTDVGLEIAMAVGSTAPGGAVNEFLTVANNSGSKFGTELASAAGSYVNIGAGGRGGNGGTMSFFGGTGAPSGSGGGGGGCRNPSCT